MLIDHIRAIRRNHQFKTALILLVIECNLGNEAEWVVARLCEKMPYDCNLRVYKEQSIDDWGKERTRTGFRTTDLNKEDAVGSLNERLFKQKIHLYSNWIQTREDYVDAGMPSHQILLNEMSNFSRKYIPPKQDYQDGKYVFAGKTSGRKDDAVMSLLINGYVSENLTAPVTGSGL